MVRVVSSLLALSSLLPHTSIVGASPVEQKERLYNNVCTTESCKSIANDILTNLHPDYESIDPCVDFDQYVCGGWREKHPRRPDQSIVATIILMAEHSQELVREILELPDYAQLPEIILSSIAPEQKEADTAIFGKMQTFYQACMDKEALATVGSAPVKKMMEEVLQQYDEHDFMATLLYLMERGVTSILTYNASPDALNQSITKLNLDAPWFFGLPSLEYYSDESIASKYQKVITDTMSKLLPDEDPTMFDKIVAFEATLLGNLPSQDDRRDVNSYYNPMTVEDAQKLAPSLEIEKFARYFETDGHGITDMVVTTVEYVKKLPDVLEQYGKGVVRAFFAWNVLLSMEPFLEGDDVKPLKDFVLEMQGSDPTAEPPRHIQCTLQINDYLGWILSSFYTRMTFTEKGKKMGEKIVERTKAEFVKRIEAVEWMDDATKAEAIQKVHNLGVKIGYSDKSPNVLDPDQLQTYYENITVSTDSPTTLFDSVLSSREDYFAKDKLALTQPTDRNKWGMTMPTVNAYYHQTLNEIVFLAGIMQRPLFDAEIPDYLNYGAFGLIAGHEISHAFDSDGRFFDKDGRFNDWWSESTAKNFNKSADCFVEQFSKYTVNDTASGRPVPVNGQLTLGENIADSGGLSVAYRNWKSLPTDEAQNWDLPGLENFTHDQLFFISYGMWWCSNTSASAELTQVYRDPHAPMRFRTLGAVANSRDFLEAFQCPTKDPVCELW